jgi:hypothetical protein
MSVLGALVRLPGIRAPTTSSSANPSPSLFAPALSDGGPRGRAEDERICCGRLKLPASLEGVGAASELRTASSRDDMVWVTGRAVCGWGMLAMSKSWRGDCQHAKRESRCPNREVKYLAPAPSPQNIKSTASARRHTVCTAAAKGKAMGKPGGSHSSCKQRGTSHTLL